MRKQEITCTVCPMGCQITVTGRGSEIVSVEGHTCQRGEAYARDEYICPVRTLTTTVRVLGGTEKTLAVRTAGPVPKEKLFACMEVIRTSVFRAPIAAHQVLIEDLAGTGVDLIASTEGRRG